MTERSSQADIAELQAAMAATARNQALAADPAASAWVSANAGTGKTFVLVNRVLRLMLAGTAPDRILCLTYTKAAAAEMANRLFKRLAHWATADDAALGQDLAGLLGRPASAAEIAQTRTLFAVAIETPGGLKVQTIHAFCERLLQRFPLEAGVSPSFTILDEEARAEIERGCIAAVLDEAASGRDALLAEALATVVASAANERFDDVLRMAMTKRVAIRRLLAADDGSDPFVEVEQQTRRVLGVRGDVSAPALLRAIDAVLPRATAVRLQDALASGSATDKQGAERLAAWLRAPDVQARHEALRDLFLTKDDGARASLMTNGLRKAHPDLEAGFEAAQAGFVALHQDWQGLQTALKSVALLRLADVAIAHYGEEKARRAALDYEDLIECTGRLLSTSPETQWVLFKLDGGLDHILVDEAQDTSPHQWRVVRALADEFHAGTGTRESVRTVFAVGDEKQSIYGFQGAEPRMFAEMGRDFGARVTATGALFHRTPLNLSFRSTSPVLDAVDRVFANADAAACLTAERSPIRHVARRKGHGGLVEIWPVESAQKQEPAEAWSPLAEETSGSPMHRLAARIADRIAAMVGGEHLASEGRPIQPGDILILLRKRRPFAPAIIGALKDRGIPVAGADRIRVTEQIGVEDLIALGEFLLLPEDDLALASVLKSPLFGLDDDDLLKLAEGRRGSLWHALLAHAEDDPRFLEPASALKRWRSQADFLPPFEFYASLLDKDGRRERLLARLGPEAADAIDEFLNLAIRYDAAAPPSLQGFLHWLHLGQPEIRRDMDQGRNEVRVMTVHGAKGLEAPIVFLPDTCSARGPGDSGELLAIGPADTRQPLIWLAKSATSLAAVAAARTDRKQGERHEYHRLLYVAMTRPRDRLYVAGFEGTRRRDEGCWYDLIEGALADVAVAAEVAGVGTVRRLETPQALAPDRSRREAASQTPVLAYPDWARRTAPREETAAIPLAPSKLAPIESDEGSGLAPPLEPSIMPPQVLAGGNRFLRGSLTHALLQHLPELPAGKRKTAAKTFLDAMGQGLTASGRRTVLAEVLAVIEHPQLAMLFGESSQAEVPITAAITLASGASLEVTGQIDRLAVDEKSVWIIDFKTNRPPPTELQAVPEAYLLQLAAYRMVLAKVYPRHNVQAALLWTDGARLMPVPAEALDLAERKLLAGKQEG